MNRSTLVFFLVTLFLGFVFTEIKAQPSKFGKISKQDMAMTGFEPDPEAAAIVLFDRAEISLNENFQIDYHRHKRIKLLKSSSFDEWGTVDLRYVTALKQKIRDLKATTYNLESNGKIKKTKVKGGDMFDSKINDNVSSKKWTFPNLQEGSIIEFTYKVRGDFGGYIPGWVFQSTEPTLWSEFKVKLPSFLSYTTLTNGIVGFDEQSDEPFNDPISRLKGNTYRWVLKSIPAFRDEPHMTARSDYLQSINLHLRSYIWNGERTDLLGTWKTVAKTLHESDSFGRGLKLQGKGKDILKEILAELPEDASKRDQTIAIFDYVKKNTKWNGNNAMYAHESGSDYILKNEEGDTADINFLLLALLREAGIPAEPLLVSTRSHGRTLENIPLINQFNMVLAAVRIGGQWIPMDASSPYRPYNMLPPRALNGKGFLVLKDDPKWIPLNAGSKYRKVVSIDAALSENGMIEGRLENAAYGFAGLEERNILSSGEDDMSFATGYIASEWAEAGIDSVVVSNTDELEEPVKTKLNFKTEGQATIANDLMYLDHIIIDKTEENPFTLQNRSYPVDMTYASKYEYTLNLSLPDGFEVVELPADKKLTTLGGGITATRRAEAADGRITIRSVLDYKRSVYKTNQYKQFREFHDELVALEGEQIVLRIKSE